MGEWMMDWKRTMMCGEMRKEHAGQEITLMGWVQRRRDLGKLIFVSLRDREGIAQVIFDGTKDGDALFEKAGLIRTEYVLAVRGTVQLRGEKDVNPNMPTGAVELVASELKILSESETPPFLVDDERPVNEVLRLKYRYLDLRKPAMLENLRLRHRLTQAVHEYLDAQGFIEVETPMLTAPTPEGARDYLVPSRVHPGKFFALPQSPQLFKQLLMVSGVDRYYQLARCFRDEDLRADRQPDFTQIDLEMSFCDQEDVLKVAEGMLGHMFQKGIGVSLPERFPRITFREAMERYGCDKPDMRFDMLIENVSDLAKDSGFSVFAVAVASGGSVRAINAKGCGGFTRKEIDALVEVARTYKAKGMAWLAVNEDATLRGSFLKFLSDQEQAALLSALDAKPGDLLLFVADRDKVALAAIGQVRLELGKKLGLMDKNVFRPLWVTEFPFFEYDEESGQYLAQHHPFTSPMDEDVPLLDSVENFGRVRAKAYDIVINGVEIASGSIRIHDTRLQEKMLGLLGFSKQEAWKRFGFLLQAFQYGPPPHGGIAPGLDRLVMLMAGADSLRDVIAFPKLQNASCPLTDAPSVADQAQIDALHIALNLPKKEDPQKEDPQKEDPRQ